jgi:FkbM family methyltransferase
VGRLYRGFGMSDLTQFYNRLYIDRSIPPLHTQYLRELSYTPNVIYDIGSAALHWYKEANSIWKDSDIYCFEAMESVEEFYMNTNVKYHIGVLSDVDGKEVKFWENEINFGGNSYYKENSEYSPNADVIFTEENSKRYITSKLDTIVVDRNLPLPDMIKIDVQGCEVDVLNGARETLKSVNHLIVELQHVEYNIGANLVNESLPFIESLGFELVPNVTDNQYFCGNGPDADYHFIKKSLVD